MILFPLAHRMSGKELILKVTRTTPVRRSRRCHTTNADTSAATTKAHHTGGSTNAPPLVIAAGLLVSLSSGWMAATDTYGSLPSPSRSTTQLEASSSSGGSTDTNGPVKSYDKNHGKNSHGDNDDKEEKVEDILHTLFVWDFDWTVINCNSDEYIPAQFLSKEELKTGFRDLYKSTNGDWHACVEGMVSRAIDKLKTEGGGVVEYDHDDDDHAVNQIMASAQRMPFLFGVKEAIHQIKFMSPKTGQMILSDGNTLFIGAFLEKYGLVDHFNFGVISNTGIWMKKNDDDSSDDDDRGGDNGGGGCRRLKVIHQSQQYGGHDCDRCSANLCKTQALTNTLCSRKDLDLMDMPSSTGNIRPFRIVYIGDGGNDACPVLNVLQEGDIMLARVGNRRRCANERIGCETDEEATCYSDCNKENQEEGGGGGSPFGIMPALQAAMKQDPPLLPKCKVWEWHTGNELRQQIERILDDVR